MGEPATSWEIARPKAGRFCGLVSVDSDEKDIEVYNLIQKHYLHFLSFRVL